MTQIIDVTTRASMGGKARAASLSTEEKTGIAKHAASERWARERGLPRETHTGMLRLGEGIPCSVLSDGQRVFSVNGLTRAFGSGGKGRGSTAGPALPPVLAAANLRTLIKPELMAKLTAPVEYRAMSGGRLALGYQAEVLHAICDVLLSSRAAGVLRRSQTHYADAAELMMRGFAQVGVVALIDEATGFQAERAQDELHKILEAYIAKELLPWTRRFPPEFFEQVYRLHGWPFKAGNTQRPGCVGHFINKFVYEQLPDGVLEKLREKNPSERGRRPHKHFQFLTKHTGNPHLDKQIIAVTTAMKLSDDRPDFFRKFQKLYPPRDGATQVEMFLEEPATPAALEPAQLVGGVSQRTLDYMSHGNTVATKDVCMAVRGRDGPAALNTMRKLLNALRKKGMLETPSPGLWRLAPVAAQ